jgi:hypothetical protein
VIPIEGFDSPEDALKLPGAKVSDEALTSRAAANPRSSIRQQMAKDVTLIANGWICFRREIVIA